MNRFSISDLKRTARQKDPVEAIIHAQIEKISLKEASNGKPYYELVLRDASESMTLRAWADTEAYDSSLSRRKGDFIEVEGSFNHNGSFGLDARGWNLHTLSEEQRELLLQGSAEHQALLETAWHRISDAVESLIDPRFKALCKRFLELHGDRFRRAAAARSNHHARRGGLLEHTSRMMESALAIGRIYPELNRDLMIAGVLFHDTGKLWETCPPERGFGIETELRGELIGHLSIGIELVNALWRELPKDGWKELSPPTEVARIHLLHLIAAHHGQLEFGSPILPKTPEATILHFVDNIDAKMEMFSAAYLAASANDEDFKTPLDWVRPLGVSPVLPLLSMLSPDSKDGEIHPTTL